MGNKASTEEKENDVLENRPIRQFKKRMSFQGIIQSAKLSQFQSGGHPQDIIQSSPFDENQRSRSNV